MAPEAGPGDRFNNSPPNQEHSHGEDLGGACSYLSEFSLLHKSENRRRPSLFRVPALHVRHPAFRLVVKARAVPAGHERSRVDAQGVREAADVNAEVREPVDRDGYSLFRIGLSLSETRKADGTRPSRWRCPCKREHEEETMGRGILLWLLGVPIPVILLLWLFFGH
jgi:hypothetical protein